MRHRGCILGIDAGTTGVSAVLVDDAGGVRAHAHGEVAQTFPRPGWVEQDPNEMWRVVQDTASRAMDQAGDVSVEAIGLTNQRETVIVWDRTTGEPIHPAIVWQCRRTADACADLRSQGVEADIREKTGLVIDPYFSATKLRWLLDHVRAARASTASLAFGTADTWLLSKLTGGSVHVTDHTNAARTLLYDIHHRDWDDGLLDLFGVPSTMLPSILPSASEFGRTAGLEFLPDGVPIAGIAGDQQAALFGHLAFEARLSKNTYGTGCFLLMYAGIEPPTNRHGLLTTLACAPDGSPAYALEGSIFTTGAVIQWLRDDLGLLDSATESETVAASVEDTGGVVFVPALTGLGAPYWDPDARGTILGLTRGTTRAHVVRAALEGIAHRTADVVDAMQASTGARPRVLRVDGGASANDFLMQFQADVLGIAVERPRNVETTVLGAVYLAGIQQGFWTAAELEALYALDRLFIPSPDETLRQARRESWRAGVERVTGRIPERSGQRIDR